MSNNEMITPEVGVKPDTSAAESALTEQISEAEMNQLLEDAKQIAGQKAAGFADSPEIKARLAEIAEKAEIAKKTPMGTSPDYVELAKLLLEMGGPDVSTEAGRNMLRMSTQHMLDNARNAMRAERESFENQVNHFVNSILENEDFKNATDKAGILNNVMAGIASDIDSGTLSEEETKVMSEVVARLKQLA